MNESESEATDEETEKFSHRLFLIKGQAGQREKRKTFLCKYIKYRESPPPPPSCISNYLDSK